ncbi:MAG: hypothetical protein CVV64_05200 [Candidatus Wallbacteria bacterium HGW-Wallbacteria-1]|jgi:tetratricopeptide (TPR) repeat protein|uniref:Uncharacterized protein n=1 Tax=Candidatus Wallbacteria bacterium HGW-Wallbacteria-1 TaxID=2013854 RepID=A0A2N1PS46_9BACT|nr:MAG: hypothetical protein CVV64_05200 [Candidatus Wallbacteria bacterium HGW-Wallbacteria-1]
MPKINMNFRMVLTLCTILFAVTLLTCQPVVHASVAIYGDTSGQTPSTGEFSYYVRMGNFFYVNGDLPAAANFLKSALSINPYREDLYTLLGTVLENSSSTQEAINVYRQGLLHFPKSEKILLFLGLLQEKEGMVAEACETFEKVLEINPDSVNAINCLAETHIRAGQFQQAINVLEKALLKISDNYVLNHNMGWALYELGNNKEAVRYLEKALEINSRFPLSWIILGNIKYREKKTEEAVKAFEKALEADPENLEATVFLGEILFLSKNFGKAAEILKKALELGAQSPKVTIGLAWSLFSTGDTAGASAYCDILLRQKEEIDSPTILNDVGWLLCRLKRSEEGIQLLDKAVEIDPTMEVALNNLFFSYNQAGNNEKALIIAEKLAAIRPDSSQLHNSMGWLQLQVGQLDEAIISFSRALQIEPELSLAQNNMGLAYYLKGNPEKAYECYEKVVIGNQSPDTVAYALNNMALLDFKVHKMDAAEKNFRMALKKYPDYIPALNNLGILLNTLGRDAEAEDLYNRVTATSEDKSEIAVAHFQIALLKIKKEDFDTAIQYLLKVRSGPDKDLADKSSLVEASIHFRTGKFANCISLLEPLLKNSSYKAEASLNLGNVNFKLGAMKRAEECFRLSAMENPEDPVAHNALAYLLALENRNLPEALDLVNKAIELAGKNDSAEESLAAYLDTRGWILYQMGRYEEAITEIEASLKLAGELKENDEIHYHMAMTLMKLGKVREAASSLEKSWKSDPESEFGKKSRALMDIISQPSLHENGAEQ